MSPKRSFNLAANSFERKQAAFVGARGPTGRQMSQLLPLLILTLTLTLILIATDYADPVRAPSARLSARKKHWTTTTTRRRIVDLSADCCVIISQCAQNNKFPRPN